MYVLCKLETVQKVCTFVVVYVRSYQKLWRFAKYLYLFVETLLVLAKVGLPIQIVLKDCSKFCKRLEALFIAH